MVSEKKKKKTSLLQNDKLGKRTFERKYQF